MRMIATAALATAALAATPALADRAPTAQERTAVENVLKASGFTSWEEIEHDDDGPHFEVDDARKNGQAGKWDVKIDPATMKIVRAERDD